MGAGFERRYADNPGAEVLGQIEGTVIIDSAPPGSIQGVGTGCVAAIGECADAYYAVSVAANGDISANPRPVRVYSPADLLEQVGGFDETIGQFGDALGNLYASLMNKRYPALVLVPVDNVTPASGTNKGIRVYRDLPTNTSPTVATPVVTLSAAVVLAGREFKNSTNRVRLARRVTFTDAAAIATGTDGVLATAAAAAVQDFTSASATFAVSGVVVGSIIVIGVIGTNNAANTKTFRVQEVTSATALKIELLSGQNFACVTETALVYRIHPAGTADSCGMDDYSVQASADSGYRCAARPLDASISAGLVLTPTVVPDTATATVWDTLSGLGARVSPGAALTYSAAVHAPNAASSATLDARYLAALESTMNDDEPSNLINIVVCARKSDTIRSALKAHVGSASGLGLTRSTCASPKLSTVSLNTVIGSAAPGVGATRSERVWYAWPGYQHFVSPAVNLSVARADAGTTIEGYLDETSDFLLASVLANIAPEENPGQVGEPFTTLFAAVAAYQRNLTTKPNMAAFTAMRAAGVVGLRRDRDDGWLFQSGVTSDLTSGRTTIARRRMADFIQDSMARRTNKLVKKLAKDIVKDAILTEIETFLGGLRSDNNKAAQRIADYSVDDRSGNTPALEAAGIHVILSSVRTLPSLDVIVLQTDIGNGVAITRAL